MKAELTWLEDPEVFQINRLPAHSDHPFFETKKDMDAGKHTLYQSLNGSWKFAWSPRPGDRPARFFEKGYDDSAWADIQVPGHIELQGYDKVHYINTMYPWEGHKELRPPYIDWEYDPVGSYVRKFDLKEGFQGKRVCISFQGVEEAFYVWLNGRFVGYGEDSFTPSDFDLTPFLRRTGNRLCVEVYKRSSAAWIEDQDFFRFSGIFRHVYLYAKPAHHVEDVWVQAGLADDYSTGLLHLRMKISSAVDTEGNTPAAKAGGPDTQWIKSLKDRGLSVEWRLEDRDGRHAASGVCEDGGTGQKKDTLKQDAGTVSYLDIADCRIPGVHLWNSQDPYLYRLVILIREKDGAVCEAVSLQTGFRRFEIRDRVMLLNGQRIIVNGVNRHEWNPRTGRCISEEDMRRDIEILRRNHINAVRTCHYPNQSLWYRLCDENGIYVMDEANLESHGSWQKMGVCEPSWNVPGSRPEWMACVLDRAVSMLERDKNHASILWWSCGNESYAGTCILAMSRYFREKDPGRTVHYEGVYWNREFDEISDVESRMYASPEEVRAYLENDPAKPYLLCEYMHGMGNSMGGMESYRRLVDEFPMCQGGFIWDYIDQAIYRKDCDGGEVLGYGGDFDDRPSDYAFSGNGIVSADRNEKPAMQEVRYWYSSAGERTAFDREVRRQADCARRSKPGCGTMKKEGSLTVIHGDTTLGVKGGDFHIIFSYEKYGIVSLVFGGREWVYRPPMPAFWRACTENDRGNGFPVKSAVWCGADQFITCRGWDVSEEDKQVSVTYQYVTSTVPETSVSVAYTVKGCGDIHVSCRYFGKKGLPGLPLFGLRFPLPFPAARVQWMGLSGETYPDRKRGGSFGIWESGLEKPAYLVPQEYGCHVDTRWMRLYPGSERPEEKGQKQSCLEIAMSGRPFHFSAIPYTPHELESALHTEELPEPRRTVVSILGTMRGVGGIDSWGSDVESKYQISAEKDIEYEFIIRGRC